MEGRSTVSAITAATTLSAAVLGALVLLRFHQQRREQALPKRGTSGDDSTIPVLRTYIPYVGATTEFFASLAQFGRKYHERFHGSAFMTTILGQRAYILYDPRDIESLMKSPESQVSLYQAVLEMGGALLPREDRRDYEGLLPEQQKKIWRGEQWENAPSTLLIAHAVRPPNLKAWTPLLRGYLHEKFAALTTRSPSGKLDLLVWCEEVISGMTARMLLGRSVSIHVLDEWTRLLRIAEPEKAFSGGNASIQTLIKVFLLRRERPIYERIRQLVYPYVDAEIELCLAGCGSQFDQKSLEPTSVMRSMVHFWYDKLNQDESALRASRRRIANDMFFFTFAAVVNSFTMTTWVLYHMLRNTAGAGDRIRAELEAVQRREANNAVEPLDLMNLPELEKVIQEIGRLYTPAMAFRKSSAPWAMPSKNNRIIPAGSFLFVPAPVALRNPNLFVDPTKFDLTRYDPDCAEHTKAQSVFMIFGAGAHPCVGRRFAMLEVALFVYEVLQHLELKLVDDDKDHPRSEDPFTQSFIDIPNHPPLDPSQAAAIWRPLVPIWVEYQRKTS